VGHEVLTIMGEALRYQPSTLEFPEDESGTEQADLDWVDEQALLRALRSALPIGSLLGWLRGHYPEFGDLTLLRLYHHLIERQDWHLTQDDTPCSLDLHTIRVTHYPHGLELLALSKPSKR